jgi:xanthine dehydrogenase YagR molybdenum-binding subunit
MDPVLGRFRNRNDSGYLVPTNADGADLEALFVREFDEEASLLGAKGLGELTAAVSVNRQHIRDLPITIEKLL